MIDFPAVKRWLGDVELVAVNLLNGRLAAVFNTALVRRTSRTIFRQRPDVRFIQYASTYVHVGPCTFKFIHGPYTVY